MKVGDKVLIPAKPSQYGTSVRPVKILDVIRITPTGGIRIDGLDGLFKGSYGSYTDSKHNTVYDYSEDKLSELKEVEIRLIRDAKEREDRRQAQIDERAKRKAESLEKVKESHEQQFQTILKSKISLENGEDLYQGRVDLSNVCYIILKIRESERYFQQYGKFEYSYTYVSLNRTGSFPSCSENYADTVEDCIWNCLASQNGY